METKDLITAEQAGRLLNCSRAKVERLQLKGLLNPVPTIHPRYFFKKKDVIELKSKLNVKSQSL